MTAPYRRGGRGCSRRRLSSRSERRIRDGKVRRYLNGNHFDQLVRYTSNHVHFCLVLYCLPAMLQKPCLEEWLPHHCGLGKALMKLIWERDSRTAEVNATGVERGIFAQLLLTPQVQFLGGSASPCVAFPQSTVGSTPILRPLLYKIRSLSIVSRVT